MNLTVNRYKIIAYAIILIGFFVWWTFFRVSITTSITGNWKVINLNGKSSGNESTEFHITKDSIFMSRTKLVNGPSTNFEEIHNLSGPYTRTKNEVRWENGGIKVIYSYKAQKDKLILREISNNREMILERQ